LDSDQLEGIIRSMEILNWKSDDRTEQAADKYCPIACSQYADQFPGFQFKPRLLSWAAAKQRW